MQKALGTKFPERGRKRAGLSNGSIRHLVDSLRFFGFVYVDDEKKIRITEAGERFLLGIEEPELFLRQMIKWQFPNPGQVNVTDIRIRPFIAILTLLSELWYLTRTEMYMYLYDLKGPKDISKAIEKIKSFRRGKLEKKKDERNLDRYTDYLVRILAKTGLFSIDGMTLFILDEKKEDVKSILKFQNLEPVSYDSLDHFYKYYGNPIIPELPQEKVSELRTKIESLVQENKLLKRRLYTLELPGFDEIDRVIDNYEKISKTWDPPLFFEWNTKLAFESLGGFHDVVWNGSVDDAGNPKHVALGGVPDLIVRSSSYTLVVECTLRRGVNQWNYEHRSVTEHVEKIYEKEKTAERDVFGLFIAEKINPRTINTFWGNVRDQGSVTIVPLSKDCFIELLQFHKEAGGLTTSDFKSLIKLFEKSLLETQNPKEWKESFLNIIDRWKKGVVRDKLILRRIVYLHKKVREYAQEHIGNLNVELPEDIIWSVCKASPLFEERRELRDSLDFASRFGLMKRNGNYTWSPIDDFEISIARLRKSLMM